MNASNSFCVPSQTKRQRRTSTSGAKVAAYLCADAAVEAVARDHEVGAELARSRLGVGDVRLEHELDAERLAARLQDVEQPLAADAAEAVAARGDRAALEVDVDVVPVVERADDLARGLRVGRVAGCRASGRRTRRPSRTCRTGRLRSTHADDVVPDRAFFSSSAKYRPAGPPPMQRMRTPLPLPRAPCRARRWLVRSK